MTHPELELEQSHVDRAYERLEHISGKAADVLAEPDVGGTHQSRLEATAATELVARRAQDLRLGRTPLVFGRTDTTDGERWYIGRAGVADEHGDPLVVDWRAPVAEPFYRATQRDPRGLVRRRHFHARGSRLTGIDDEVFDGDAAERAGLEVVGQGALLAALARRRTGRMGDIVATIQSSQDEVIRSPLRGVLVVQGGPGTGKTVVALHRAAYLMYSHPFPLVSQGVLVVGPNPVFLTYIEQVLPSLGEQGVTMSTPATLVPGVRAVAHETDAVAAVKGDVRMAQVVARAVRQRQRPLREDAVVGWGAHRLTLTVEESTAIVRRARRRRGTHNEQVAYVRRAVAEHLCAALSAAKQRLVRVGRFVDDPDGVIDDNVDALREEVRSLPEYQRIVRRMWPRLTPEDLLGDLFERPSLLARAADGVLTDDEVEVLLSGGGRRDRWTHEDVPLLDEALALLGSIRPPVRPAVALEEGDQLIIEQAIDVTNEVVGGLDQDARAVLRARLEQMARDGRVGGADRETREVRTFGHVIVDEAQDLSAMGWRMIARRCPSGSMTVVGDLGQSERGASSWAAVTDVLPERFDVRHATLSIAYRTPAELLAVAEPVLRASGVDVEAPEAVRSTDVRPTVVSAPGPSAALAEAVADVVAAEQTAVDGGTVGVVAPPSLVGELQERLLGERLAADATAQLDGPVAVLDVRSAKGLEFDSVVVVEPAGIVAESTGALRSLYVALTRATERLAVVHSQPLPEPLAGGLAEG